MIRFVEYTAAHTEAVQSFNGRLRTGGMSMQYPTEVVPSWLPPEEGRRLFQAQYVGVDEHDEVRAGYILKHQEFKIGDAIVPIADLRLPISEGSVDREYASVATELLFSALSKQRLLFGMGIGGYDEPVAKLFQAASWRVFTIPFFFKVLHPYRFCRKIQFLRRSWSRRVALDLAAFTGVASLGFKCLQSFRARSISNSGIRVEKVDEFGPWSDGLWGQCQSEYAMIAVRDCAVLRLLYPQTDARFHRLKVLRGDRLLGWAVLLDTAMSDHKQFGTLRVGSFVDGLASLDDAATVVHAATGYLEERGVDLIVANHSHARWCDAYRGSGYLSGPSNYLFAGSRALDKLLRESQTENDATFINRGDGDGPINL